MLHAVVIVQALSVVMSSAGRSLSVLQHRVLILNLPTVLTPDKPPPTPVIVVDLASEQSGKQLGVSSISTAGQLRLSASGNTRGVRHFNQFSFHRDTTLQQSIHSAAHSS